jgi:low temperature requirement protein LtrA
LELFYDLIYVAAIIQVGNVLSHNIGFWGFVGFFGIMAPIWWTWTGFTFYMNRFIVDDVLHRLMVFVQMLFVGAVAVGVPYVFEGETMGFALAYGGTRVMLTLIYLRTYLQTEDARDMTLRFTVGFAVGALLWLISAFVDAPWCFAWWGLALAIDIGTSLSRRQRVLVSREYPPDVHHMTERYGLLTIIVLGESFVKVLTAVAETGLTPTNAMMGGLALGVTCFLWWLYFDDIGGSRIKKGTWSTVTWIYTHLPFTVAVVAVGVAIKKAVLFTPMETAPTKYRWMLCGTIALALVCASILDAVTERRQAEVEDRVRVGIRLASGVVVLILAPIGGGMPAWLFVTLVTAVSLLQVVFDLLTAPLAPDPETLHDSPDVGVDDEPEAGARSARRLQRRIGDAVRKGTPSELRRDLYFHLMEGSWPQLLGVMVILYLVTNGLFAGLFLLFPGGVVGVEANDFWSAFAFSVQTMSTIGYGTLAPQTGWAHFLVTVEAAVGLLGVAVATGVIFAKISRPHSSVLFSRPMVVTTHDGQPTLMFRVGNARGNEVVEATVRVCALIDEVSPEGHRFRRLHDLELVRDTSPLFTLSWTVMHEFGDASPLIGLTAANCDERIVAVVVTMTGYDSTYAQMTHARHMYSPEDIRFDHRFVDVISTLDDGRMLVDYDRFHQTIPDDDAAPSEEE